MKKIKELLALAIAVVQSARQKGFFHLLSANIFIQIAGFTSQFLVAWILTPVDIGTIKLLQSYANIASIAASFGFNSSVLKLCSELRSYPERKYLYSMAVRYTVVTSIATFILFIMASRFGIFSSDASLVPYFAIYGFIVIAIAFNNLQNSYLQALKKIPLMSKILVVTKLATILLIIGLTYFYDLNGYFVAVLFGSYLTVAVLFFGIRSLRVEREKTISDSGFKLHWFYAKYSFSSNLVYQLYLSVDVILINHLITEKVQIGYYSFALMLVVPFEVLRGTIQQIVVPYFSEKAIDHKELIRVIGKYHKLLLVLSLIAGVIAITIIPHFIQVVFNGKYDPSVGFFQILMIAWVIRCFYSIKSYALWAIGKVDVNFLVVLLTIIPTFVMVYFCINVIGLIGAALAVAGSELVLLGINEYCFRKYVKSLLPVC